MKLHTQAFKEQIKEMGRELDSIITFGDTVLGNEQLNAVTPSFQGNILKSVMKQLDIDSNVKIPIGTILNYKFGVKVDGNYEYIDFGNYIVKDVEKQEDTNSYKITCYDKILYSMVDYEDMALVYPITIRDYIKEICAYFNLTFKNENDEFANFDKQIPNELYLDENGKNIGYTFRDVLDELAQVTASTICLNENDELEIRYISETNDIIDEEFLKDVNVNFGEKFGAINTIVLSRSADSDSIYYPENLPENPYEIKISDNQIMNGNDRVDFLPDIYEKLNGLEFYINDFSSTGICYYDICDRYNVKVGDNTYSCVMFNSEILITQGLVENIYTDLPEESQTDYLKSDTTDRRINQAYLIVDKQNKTITGLVQQIDENSEQITTTTQKVNGFEIDVKNVQTSINTVAGEVSTLSGTITDMNFAFSTKGLSVGTSQDSNNSLLDNTGIKVYNYNTLNAIFNNKGSGIDKLIVTGSAQIGYLRFIKSTKNSKPVTKIFHLNQVIEDLEDLEV